MRAVCRPRSRKYSASVKPVAIDASRPATGMLEVFTTITVRLMSGRPVRGSSRRGNSSSTSAISLPRSPQPTYTMTSAAPNFAMDCSSTVFPVPKPPGTMAVPPSATGKSTSRMRWPVRKGVSGGSRRATGRGRRTGQRCSAVSARPPTSTTSGSSSPTSPRRTSATTPSASGGASTGSAPCPAPTWPRRAPGRTRSPAATAGVKSSLRARSSAGARSPRARKSPPWLSASRGRCRPSKMRPSSPGPSSAWSGAPVGTAGSPRQRPAVSS